MSAGTTASMNVSSDSYPSDASMDRVSSGLGPMWRLAKRSAGASEARTVRMTGSLGEGVGLARLEDDHPRTVSDTALELHRVGLDHVPGIVVHWKHGVGPHQLHRAHRVFDAHRVIVADR